MKLRGAQFLLAFVFLGEMAARAQNLDTIGVTLLQAVTTNVNGAGIRVAQPEAADDLATTTNWEVNPGSGRPAGESFHLHFQQLAPAHSFPNAVGGESGHADAVAGYFYGIPGGVATNVAHVDNYDGELFFRISNASSVSPIQCRCPRNINDPVVNQSFIFDPEPPLADQQTH